MAVVEIIGFRTFYPTGDLVDHVADRVSLDRLTLRITPLKEGFAYRGQARLHYLQCFTTCCMFTGTHQTKKEISLDDISLKSGRGSAACMASTAVISGNCLQRLHRLVRQSRPGPFELRKW